MRKDHPRTIIPAGICIAALCFGATVLDAQPAELVVRNANVLTVDAKNTRVTAFAIARGAFLAVGSDEVKSHIDGKTRVIDLKGKTVTPGFIDAHCHPSPVYPEDRMWASVDLYQTKAMDDLVAALKEKAAKMPKGLTVQGARYRDTLLGRHPTRRDLDRVSTEHPVVISHSSGHLRVCNSYALQLANLDESAVDPSGGEFERDAAGELTGVLKESASSRVTRALPAGLDAREPFDDRPRHSDSRQFRFASQPRAPAAAHPEHGDAPL